MGFIDKKIIVGASFMKPDHGFNKLNPYIFRMHKKLIILLTVLNIAVFIYVGILIKSNINTFESFIFPRESQRKDIRRLLKVNLSEQRMLPDVRVLVSEEISEGTIRKKIIFKPEKNLEVRKFIRENPETLETRGFLFHPADTSKKYPAVVIFHGHGKGVHNTSITRDAYELAEELAKNNFVTFTFSFKDIEKSMGFKNHRIASRYLLLKGQPIMSTYIHAGIRALDYLTYLEFADRNALGVAGESRGGHVAVYVAALEKRVKSVVDAAYFGSYYELPDSRGCTCNYIPGILEKYDFPVVSSLIAPRAALYIIGKKDEHNSVANSKNLINKIVYPEYEKYRQLDKLKLLIHDGGHEMLIKPAVEWFKKTLGRS